MHPCAGRYIRPDIRAEFGLVLLLLSVVAGVAGCRSESIGPGSATSPIFTGFKFSLGDTLAFDFWDLDQYGSVVPSSKTRYLWSVMTDADSLGGFGGVTSVSVLSAPGYPPAVGDTLYFRFLPSGDIYQYGFIAQAVRAAGLPPRAPTWDRIAAFSLPTNSIWSVGSADTSGLDTLQGTVVGDQGYFEAGVNGVPTVSKGYGVSLVSESIQFELVASNLPPAFLFIQEQSTPFGSGYVETLASIVTSRRGP